MPIINRSTRKVVRIGDTCVFPGDMVAQVRSFDRDHVVYKLADGLSVSMPFSYFDLEAVTDLDPSELMTDDDWTHASNRAREAGGHFAGSLAKAYQYADSTNRKPIRKSETYRRLFFSFLSSERQEELKKLASE